MICEHKGKTTKAVFNIFNRFNITAMYDNFFITFFFNFYKVSIQLL